MTTRNHNVSDRPVPDDFFVKLWAMNWVEKEWRRQKALGENAGPIVTQVFVALKDSIVTFNKFYRADRDKLAFSPMEHSITFSMPLPLKGNVEHEIRKQAEGVIEFDASHYAITATFKGVTTEPVALQLDADEAGKVFLRDHFGAKILDMDSASRVLLGQFLMTLANL